MSGLDQLAKVMQKSMETTANLASGMGVDINEDLVMKTFQYSPLLQVLEGKGRTRDVNKAEVTFFREEPTNTAAFIDEGGQLPAFGETSYTPITDRMKELAESISISEMAQDGTDVVDLAEREITRSFLQVDTLQDYTLLQGTGTAASKDFASILKDIPNDNKSSVNPAGPVTEDAIDDMLIQVVDECGGHPDILVTDNFVAKQLKAIAAPYRRYNDKVEIGLGFKVASYESPDGSEIPILVDKNMPSGTKASPSHKIVALDTSAVDIAYLHRPAVKEMPSTTLSNNFVVRTHVTACNIAPWKCGLLEGITSSS